MPVLGPDRRVAAGSRPAVTRHLRTYTKIIRMTALPIPLTPRTIAIPGLLMRPFTEDDVPSIAEALHDPQILRWATGVAVAKTPEDKRAQAWYAVRQDSWAEGTALFAITDADDGALLGSINVREINRGPSPRPPKTDWLCTGSPWTTPCSTPPRARSPTKPASKSRAPCATSTSKPTAGATTHTCTPA